MPSKHDAPPAEAAVAAAVSPMMRKPGTADRFGATLALALIAHGILILGIGFAVDRPAAVRPTLDIILSQSPSEQAPEDADFLAQSNQTGGGEAERPERPRTLQPATMDSLSDGLAPEQILPQAPTPPPESAPSLLTSSAETAAAPVGEPEVEPEPALPPGPDLVELRLEMARLVAEIDREQALLAKSPKRKFVSASTREFEWAEYVRSWVQRVERIGNLNYPDEARLRNLHGSLVLTVAVRADGSLESIDLVRSSGHPLLDEAAMRTVRLAQPFQPLPANNEAVDVLHITRTWQYLAGGTLRQRP